MYKDYIFDSHTRAQLTALHRYLLHPMMTAHPALAPGIPKRRPRVTALAPVQHAKRLNPQTRKICVSHLRRWRPAPQPRVPVPEPLSAVPLGVPLEFSSQGAVRAAAIERGVFRRRETGRVCCKREVTILCRKRVVKRVEIRTRAQGGKEMLFAIGERVPNVVRLPGIATTTVMMRWRENKDDRERRIRKGVGGLMERKYNNQMREIGAREMRRWAKGDCLVADVERAMWIYN